MPMISMLTIYSTIQFTDMLQAVSYTPARLT